MVRKKVIILDDHPLMLKGLKNAINKDPLLYVSDICLNSTELFFSLNLAPADIAVVDCSSPVGEMDIRALVEKLHFQYPEMALIAMGDCVQHRKISEQLQPKLRGYFCKTLAAENFISGLLNMRAQLINETMEVTPKFVEAASLLRTPSHLSEKEKTVLEYLHAGLSVTQTAIRVNRSVKTISSQKRTAMRKLGIKQDRDIFQLKMHEL